VRTPERTPSGGSRFAARIPDGGRDAYTGLTFPESDLRKVIIDACTGKADFIAFSVCDA
jgi:hypothetical protein